MGVNRAGVLLQQVNPVRLRFRGSIQGRSVAIFKLSTMTPRTTHDDNQKHHLDL